MGSGDAIGSTSLTGGSMAPERTPGNTQPLLEQGIHFLGEGGKDLARAEQVPVTLLPFGTGKPYSAGKWATQRSQKENLDSNVQFQQIFCEFSPTFDLESFPEVFQSSWNEERRLQCVLEDDGCLFL